MAADSDQNCQKKKICSMLFYLAAKRADRGKTFSNHGSFATCFTLLRAKAESQLSEGVKYKTDISHNTGIHESFLIHIPKSKSF